MAIDSKPETARKSLFGKRRTWLNEVDAPGFEAALDREASRANRDEILSLNPDRVRIWSGNARFYAALTPESCTDLIDSIEQEGGQRIPAIVRRVTDDPDHDYEVIAGSRRHFAVGWLRHTDRLDTPFIAIDREIDDEAAFRLSDLENRARRDVTDLERGRNYAAALHDHYGGKLTDMANRLAVSKSWLSKMIRMASLPEEVIAAFGSIQDIRVKPAYTLALALDSDTGAKRIPAMARQIATAQTARREDGLAPYPAAEVMKFLLDAAKPGAEKPEKVRHTGPGGAPALSVLEANNRSLTLRIHAKSGTPRDALIAAIVQIIDEAEQDGLSFQ